MTHSPTPWRIEKRENSDYEKYNAILDANGDEVVGVCATGYSPDAGASPDISDEDAASIVTFVNLHDELVAMLKRVTTCFGLPSETEILDEADKLLAKAKGESDAQ